jgi:glutamyl-tRNA synthetase
MEVRVRYAPSPTGLQHIGGIRTALFNYLFARSMGGTFILRLEDTDRTRYSEEYVKNLFDSLAWFGMDWDEGPDVGGPYGPYVQSERFALYAEYAEKLVSMGKAYRCYCTSERLEKLREEQTAAKSGSGYDRHCRNLTEAERADLERKGVKSVIRLKVPLEGVTKFHDHILGDIEWKNEDVNPDPVLLKSDGFPTYHLANVVDDHFMKITHVMRAQEWIPSTPLHVVMYEAFGWDHPEYCHLPMVMGEDGHKLSKRHGSTSVNEFRSNGYLPDAIINYVALLGCSFEEGRDIYSLADLAKLFKMDKLNKAPAVFDYKKLEWYDGQYIRTKSEAELAALCLPYLQASGLVGEKPTEADTKRLAAAIPLVRERLSFVKDAPDMLRFLFADVEVANPADLIPKKLDAAKAKALLEASLGFIPAIETESDEAMEAKARAMAEGLGVKLGDLMMPVRVAVTGTKVSPPLFGSIRALGTDAALKRVNRAIALL